MIIYTKNVIKTNRNNVLLEGIRHLVKIIFTKCTNRDKLFY